MPTYEYVCTAGHETDHRHSIKDDPLETCPREDCGAPAERKISMGGGLISGERDSAAAQAPGGGDCGPSGFT